MKTRRQEIMTEVEIEDGQSVITIPRAMLRALGVKPGDKVEIAVDERQQGVVVRKHLPN